MKTLLRILIACCLATTVLAVNQTIETIPTTIVLPASNDFIPVSGATRGTNKFNFTGLTFSTQTRATLAALSITGAADGTGILVLGGAAIGDGGGASYFWSAASSATPNGTTIIQPASLPATGRWLIAVGGVAAPGVATLGGVFSNAGSASRWVSAINTNGTVTLTQPSAGDILGLGSMSLQGAATVAITGGTLDGVTIGGVTPGAATFSSLTIATINTTGNATIGTGTGTRTMTINGGSVSGQGAAAYFARASGTQGFIGTDSAIFGGSSNDIDVGGNTGVNLKFYANNVLQGYTTTNGELNFGFGIFTKPIATFDSASGGLYLGYGAGTALIRSSADNSGSYAPISFLTGSATVAIMDSTGLVMQPTYKAQQATAPTAGIDLTNKAYVDSVAGSGSAKVFNVRAYGATGNGSTNDTASINVAIAAMTSGSTLYFPAGKYLVTLGGITAFTTLSNITIMGDGRSSQLYSSATGTAGNTYFLFFSNGCSKVTIRDFSLIGSATSRGSGGHGLICYASSTLISGLYITGTSDFGMYCSNGGGAGSWSNNIMIVNCVSDHTLGDGFHFGAVTDSGIYNCISNYTGDDGIGIGDDGGIGSPPTRIEVVGFQSFQAGNHAGGGTHGAGIRIFDGAIDVHVTGGQIAQSCEAGITAGRFFTTTSYNTRIIINGLKVFQCLQQAGMYANMNFAFCNGLSIQGCWSEAPVSQCCYSFLDIQNLSVIGNTAKDAVVRSFVTDDGTTTNVAATWANWTFSSNVCLGAPSNESFYIVPNSAKRISNLIVTGNTETGQSAANYITTNYLSGTVKINNNTSLGGKAIVFGGTGSVPTTANNN